jgi:hypothetical protein
LYNRLLPSLTVKKTTVSEPITPSQRKRAVFEERAAQSVTSRLSATSRFLWRQHRQVQATLQTQFSSSGVAAVNSHDR